MTDQPADPSFGLQEAIAKVLASSLPDEQKKLLVQRLALERTKVEESFRALVDELVAEAERHLREQ